MTQTNGNGLSLADKHKEITEWIDGLFSSEVKTYLTMSREDLKKLSKDDCTEICYILHSQSLQIQKRSNAINSCILWCQQQINSMADFQNVGDKYTKFEERRLLAIKQNDVLQRIAKQMSDLEQKKEAISFLTQRVENVSKTIESLRWNKHEFSTPKEGNSQ